MNMNPNWHGLIKIEEIQLVSKDGKILWEAHDLLNMLHIEGEKYMLTVAFSDKSIIPNNFYFGLDNRTKLAESDTMATIVGEPNSNGYVRVPVAGQGQMSIELVNTSYWVAKSPITIFNASDGVWGPVTNLFMTTASDSSGLLIASVPLTSTVTIQAGSSLNVRMGLGLRDCPI